MTNLRQKFIDELTLRGLSDNTVKSYVGSVVKLSLHYNLSPDLITDDQLKGYLLNLIRVEKRSASSINVAVSAFRNFYHLICGRSIHLVEQSLPRLKKTSKKPQVYSEEELQKFFKAVTNMKPRIRQFSINCFSILRQKP